MFQKDSTLAQWFRARTRTPRKHSQDHDRGRGAATRSAVASRAGGVVADRRRSGAPYLSGSRRRYSNNFGLFRPLVTGRDDDAGTAIAARRQRPAAARVSPLPLFGRHSRLRSVSA